MNHTRISVAGGMAVVLVVLCLLAPADLPARAPQFDWTYDPISFDPPEPVRYELDNGMVVYFLRDDQLPVVTLTMLIRTGEVYVPAAKTGLGDITGEVLVTGGTVSRTPEEIDEAIEFLGIRWSGSVGLESSSFSMRCLAGDFGTALDLYADLLQHPRFDSTKLQLALDNAREALRRQNDSPGRIIRREFAKLLYGDHPYGRFMTKETLNAITRAGAVEFYERFFHPNSAILSVSGSISETDLRVALETAFGGWERAEIDWPTIPPLRKPTEGVFQINKDISQTNLRFGHLGIDRHSPDRHAVRVFNHILGGGGFTSRMMGTVRSDSGLAYSVGTAFTVSNQRGAFYAACQTKTETTAKALALMQWVISDCLENGVTEEEMAIAKESILNSDVFKYATPVGIVERYAWLEYFGFDSDQLTKDVEAVRAVTRADVNAVARKILDPRHYTILAVGPIEKFDKPLGSPGRATTIELEK